eukprot:gb/GEZN01001649.1/.p1 GENE.gb/GEZN01001649.1/~~gb/GEZN01001649.1/.p1  ORF type:complete len:803 (-),score=126.58 gb/GEZN01001649.1/:191-2599(-)
MALNVVVAAISVVFCVGSVGLCAASMSGFRKWDCTRICLLYLAVIQTILGVLYPFAIASSQLCMLASKAALLTYCLVHVGVGMFFICRFNMSVSRSNTSSSATWARDSFVMCLGGLLACIVVALFIMEGRVADVQTGTTCLLAVPLFLCAIVLFVFILLTATLLVVLQEQVSPDPKDCQLTVSHDALLGLLSLLPAWGVFLVLVVAEATDSDVLRAISAVLLVLDVALNAVAVWLVPEVLSSEKTKELSLKADPKHRSTAVETGYVKHDDGAILPNRLSTITLNMRACLNLVLNDPKARQVFREYLKDTYADENLLFWLEVEELKQADGAVMAKKTQEIYNRYMAPTAENSINISSSERPNFETRADVRLLKQSIISAQETVLDLLMEGSFRDFVISERGQALYASMGAKPAIDTSLPKDNQEWIEKLTGIVSNLPFSVCVADMTQRLRPIVFVNPEFQRLTGYRTRDCVGRNCKFLQGDDTSEDAISKIRSALNDGRPLDIVITNYTKEGRRFLNFLALIPVFKVDVSLERRQLPSACCLCHLEGCKSRFHCICGVAAYCSSKCMEADHKRHVAQECKGRPEVHFFMSVQFDSTASTKAGRLATDLMLLEGIVRMLPNTITLRGRVSMSTSERDLNRLDSPSLQQVDSPTLQQVDGKFPKLALDKGLLEDDPSRPNLEMTTSPISTSGVSSASGGANAKGAKAVTMFNGSNHSKHPGTTSRDSVEIKMPRRRSSRSSSASIHLPNHQRPRSLSLTSSHTASQKDSPAANAAQRSISAAAGAVQRPYAADRSSSTSSQPEVV